MNTHPFLFALSVLATSSLAANAYGESLLRVGCVGEAEGAKVFVNGNYADTCPANLFVEPGKKTIRVVKPAGEGKERVFETSLVLQPDSGKRVDVELSQPRLTANAKREKANRALNAARAGDIEAMRQVAAFFRDGTGVSQSLEKAQYWDNKAVKTERAEQAQATLQRAEAGNIDAMRKLASLYDQGRGLEKNSSKAAQWRQKADESEAEQALAMAESGDVDAMETMASLYAHGKGVEQDSEKSNAWARKAEQTTQARLDEKKASERRERAQEKLDNIDYFENSKNTMTRADLGDNTAQAITVVSTTPLLLVPALLTDALFAPTKTIKKMRLRKALAARPAAFANPDSMIAKAHRSQTP